MSQPRTLGRNSKQLGEVAQLRAVGEGASGSRITANSPQLQAGAMRPDLFCSRPRLPRYLSLFGWLSR